MNLLAVIDWAAVIQDAFLLMFSCFFLWRVTR